MGEGNSKHTHCYENLTQALKEPLLSNSSTHRLTLGFYTSGVLYFWGSILLGFYTSGVMILLGFYTSGVLYFVSCMDWPRGSFTYNHHYHINPLVFVFYNIRLCVYETQRRGECIVKYAAIY